jgi:LPXTG-motif cell wall-anchored protein
MTAPRKPRQGGSGWMVALLAVPVLCCAGPALLAVIGAGSVGALLGGATGSITLAIAGLAVLGAACVVLLRRRQDR